MDKNEPITFELPGEVFDLSPSKLLETVELPTNAVENEQNNVNAD